MIILPPNIRIFPIFLAISKTDKPVNQSIQAYALTQLNVFAFLREVAESQFVAFCRLKKKCLSNDNRIQVMGNYSYYQVHGKRQR